MNRKVIIFSAPSGAGKSTIVNHILGLHPELEFSISATSRAPRGNEQDGKEYYFFSADEFRQMIADGKFIEHEEVYPGSFYGTLKSEVERIWAKGHVIIFDIDVKGGVNLKHIFGDKALSVFIRTSSAEELRRRLVKRGTDSAEAAKVLLPYFDGTAEESVKTSLDSYKAIDAWQQDMTMTEDAFNRLQDIIDNSGELEKRVNFSDLVDVSYSSKIYSELNK